MSPAPRTLYEARRAKDGAAALGSVSAPRPLRLPIGMAAVVGALILAFAFGVYQFGYRMGFNAAEGIAQDARQVLSNTVDPLIHTPAAADGADPVPADEQTSQLAPPAAGDPRQPGLNYFTIASEISNDRAGEMVQFCRSQGLDTVAISGHNARSQVIVLPGFVWDEKSGAPVKSLEAKIRAVGAKWKALGRGNGDFRDFYPKLFKGQS